MEQTKNWIEEMNELGRNSQPFLFIISFDKTTAHIYPKDEIPKNIFVKIDDTFKHENFDVKMKFQELRLKRFPVSFNDYKSSFDFVIDKIKTGYSYLTNLTFATRIEASYNMYAMYYWSKAKYKLLYKNKFVVFSPECFVKINDGKISTYPMKGTIDASIENAEEKLLNDEKEKAEHFTIVDLLRNDLSQVAKEVIVTKYRYIDKIVTNQSEILQTSSEIVGNLSPEFKENLGTLFDILLPAGSISGAPKKATIELIENAEKDNRGFYTGIFGYFDGVNLDSAVMIRFVEKKSGKYFFRSGGGITSMSDAEAEYKEMIDKVYVPVN